MEASGSATAAPSHAKYRSFFEFFDKDGDGTISTQDLGTVLRQLGHNPTEIELQELVKQVDKNKDGSVDIDDFVALLLVRQTPLEEEAELRAAFRLFDREGDGVISAQELAHVMSNLGEELSESEILEMMAAADLDGDGTLSFEDFKNLVKTQSEPPSREASKSSQAE